MITTSKDSIRFFWGVRIVAALHILLGIVLLGPSLALFITFPFLIVAVFFLLFMGVRLIIPTRASARAVMGMHRIFMAAEFLFILYGLRFFDAQAEVLVRTFGGLIIVSALTMAALSIASVIYIGHYLETNE